MNLYFLFFIILFPAVYTFELTDSFSYCTTNEASEFSLENCDKNISKIIQLKDFTVLEKQKHVLSGKGYFCIKEKIEIETWKTFFGVPENKRSRISIVLSRKDCIAMHLTKVCSENVKMQCKGDFCSSIDEDPEVDYFYFGNNRIFTSYVCKLYTESIYGDNMNDKVFTNGVNSCKPKDLYCALVDSSFYWSEYSLLPCLFTRVTNVQLNVQGEIAIGNNYLFQINNKSTECNMEILHTTEGSYLTTNKKALTLPKSQLGLNVNKHLMLADNDLASFRIFSIISDMNKRFEEKTCLLYQLAIEIMENQIDTFFKIKDSDNNDVTLFNKEGDIIIAKCNNISKITVPEVNQYCYDHIAINFDFQEKK